LIYPTRESDKEERYEREIEIEYPSKYQNEGLPNEITAGYLLGYDLIRIKGRHRISAQDRERIVSAIKRLIGLEVVEEDALSITSQFLVDNTAVEPKKIFKRISSIVRAMISDTLKQITMGDTSKFESVAERDDEVDRLHFLIVRLIRTAVREPRVASKFGLTSIDCLDYRVAASSLETAGDYAVELSNSVRDFGSLDITSKNHMIEVNYLLDTIQENAVRSFTLGDFKLAQLVFEDYHRLEKILKELRLSNSKSFPSLLHLVDTIERISRCQRDIADLVSPMRPA
jgi:phosphate uptake regulator